MKIIRLLLFLLFAAAAVSLCKGTVFAAEGAVITADGVNAGELTDGSIYTYKSADTLEVRSDAGMYGVYIKYDRLPPAFKAEADGKLLPQSETSYLHQFIELGGEKSFKIEYSEKACIADVWAFETKKTPDWVQKWQDLEQADIMVCPTHSDDDQLYFAGMIPWCVAEGYDVQVVYLTNHFNTHDRPHELLDGLWTCGLKYYPVISEFPDLYCTSLEEAEGVFGIAGYDGDDFSKFYLDLFEKYRPLVVACHDVNGEYGHGAHMLNAKTVMSAVEKAAEDGIWDVPKTYVHLWQENSTFFNWDEPLEYFGGKSAFEVSQEAFGCHKSQHQFESLYNWLYGREGTPITKASQIGIYSPCRYGLYRSTVGEDRTENGLFDNLEEYLKRKSPDPEHKTAALFAANKAKQALCEKHKPAQIYLPVIHKLEESLPPTDEPSNSIESAEESEEISRETADGKNGKAAFIAAAVLLAALSAAFVAFARKRKKDEGKK